MVDALVLGTSGVTRGGSSPLPRTKEKLQTLSGAFLFGPPSRTRTLDRLVKSELLYQLSYGCICRTAMSVLKKL